MPYILVAILSLHEVIAGFVLGLQKDLELALPIFISLMAHKWLEALAVGVALLKVETLTLKGYMKIILIYSAMASAGLIFGVAIRSGIEGEAADVIAAICVSIASGTFIYIAVIDILLPEFHKDFHLRYHKFFLACLGFVLISTLIFVFPHEHGDEEEGHDHAHRSLTLLKGV
eukprot:TRINITY_DN4942_c0_g3_i3.p1 TRINITY_DN4942_c0_g3~~TRINITY_DN4942_c0_g3_i3.p1  ORF type:complete len:173 (-),score=11.42 TRINITY_DN4942_c0_g3_i3:42-560(-)